MKKRTVQFLGLIEVLILLGALALFTLQNPNTLILFLNYATKELDLSYGSVEGNLLKSIKIKDITYKDKRLTNEAVVDWNIKALLTASLKIDEISIKELNIPVTQEWIDDLRKKFHHNDGSVTYIPSVEISSIFFSALPFENQSVKINRIELFAKNLRGNLRHLDIGFFSFFTESNYADITALGKLEESRLAFDKLWFENIDITKIKTFIKSRKKSSVKQPSAPAVYRRFIRKIFADSVIVYIKPLHAGHYKISQSSIALRQLETEDMQYFNAKKVFIKAITNIWHLSSYGSLQKNTLIAKARVTLIDQYFKRFVPFFNFNAIEPVTLNLKVSTEGISGDLSTHTSQLMIHKYRDINASFSKLTAHADFDFHKLNLQGDINATLHTKYTPLAHLDGHIYYNRKKRFFYDGNLSIVKVDALPKPLVTLLQKSDITFYGNTKKVTADLQNDYLTAHYDGENYIRTNLHIASHPLSPHPFFPKLPEPLHETKATVTGDIPVDFKHFMPLKPRFTVTSNLFDINGTANVGKQTRANLHLTQAKKSLLTTLLPKLRQETLFPAQLDLSYANKILHAQLQNNNAKIVLDRNFATSQTDAVLHQDPHKLSLHGNLDKDSNITFQSPSLREFQDFLHRFYRFKKIPLDGEIKLDIALHERSKADAALRGKWFVYEYKPNRFLFAEKLHMKTSYANRALRLKQYIFSTYLDRDRIFFANKTSLVRFPDKKIIVDRFYINDFARLKGHYNYHTQNGLFKLKTRNYHYNDLEGNFYFDADLEIALSAENNDIEGELTINKGTITYAPRKKHYVQDKDIIILQNQKVVVKEEDKLSLDVSVVSKRPIYYKIPNTDVKLEIDLKLWKEMNKDLELLGMVKILNGIHSQSGKEFELEPGEILFAGPPLNPYLNIHAIHHSEPYTVYVNINGQLDTPVINFSATPFLNQSDILSLLLFNSTTEELMSGNQDTSRTAISMFGSIFAKEIVQNFGIKLDKLVLTTTEEGKLGVELGKKLSRKVTLIYINDIVQTIKIRYKMSDHFETDFIFSPDNSGADLVYKDEY